MALSSTQHATLPELGGKWRLKSLNIRFPLPNLLYTGYNVKPKKKTIFNIKPNITV